MRISIKAHRHEYEGPHDWTAPDFRLKPRSDVDQLTGGLLRAISMLNLIVLRRLRSESHSLYSSHGLWQPDRHE
jgi:hypothetical protein